LRDPLCSMFSHARRITVGIVRGQLG
jgi:hypothetical protein